MNLTKNSDVFLSVSNILDRDDIMYPGTTDYYVAPCNFLLGYKLSFSKNKRYDNYILLSQML